MKYKVCSLPVRQRFSGEKTPTERNGLPQSNRLNHSCKCSLEPPRNDGDSKYFLRPDQDQTQRESSIFWKSPEMYLFSFTTAQKWAAVLNLSLKRKHFHSAEKPFLRNHRDNRLSNFCQKWHIAFQTYRKIANRTVTDCIFSENRCGKQNNEIQNIQMSRLYLRKYVVVRISTLIEDWKLLSKQV